MSLRKTLKRSFFSVLQSLGGTGVELELRKIYANPRFKRGTTDIFGTPFTFHDGVSFVLTYRELFQTHIYKFKASTEAYTILDCGANLGLSVLYFAMNYPDHKIIAFEPDREIFEVLSMNVEAFKLKNVTLHQKAVWNKDETLRFFADGGMGGRVETAFEHQKPVEIEAVDLKRYISSDVDFLKIDIEGAEGVVLNDCRARLREVRNVFFEYHNRIGESQTLHQLLELVQSEGFTYYIKESDVRKKPFLDEHIIGEAFDMALNVFCYRK